MSDDDLDALRHDLAVERGLDPVAAKLIGGETLDEIEASADALAKLVASQGTHEHEQSDPLALALATPAAEKAQRKRSLVAALHGPRQQPRDEHGRYTTGPSSFDGGARANLPASPPSHDEWLVDLLRSRRGDAGMNF